MPTYNVTVTESGPHFPAGPVLQTAQKTSLSAGNPKVGGSPKWAWGQIITSGINVRFGSQRPTYTFRPGALVIETSHIGLVQTPSMKYGRVITDTVKSASVFVLAWPRSLIQGFSIHQAQTPAWGVTLIQKFLAGAIPAVQRMRYSIALTDGPKIHDTIFKSLFGLIMQGFSIHDSLLRLFRPVISLVQNFLITSTLGAANAIFTMAITQNIKLTPTQALQMIFRGEALLDKINMFILYQDPAGTTVDVTTWAINTRTSAITEYQNYAFNSMCRMPGYGQGGHRYIGADSSGLWTLDGLGDGSTSIPVRIKSGQFQLAGSHFTSFRAAYLGLRVKDDAQDFFLKLYAPNQQAGQPDKVYVYQLQPKNMATTKVNIGKGIRSRYFAWELTSVGADFDLDTIEFVPIASRRRV